MDHYPSADLACLADIPGQSLPWLWPGWIPSGTLTILGGHVGHGKSTVATALVAALTGGQPLPDGATVDPVNVLILSAEDDPARVIRPRLDANTADISRVFVHASLDRYPDADRLRHAIESHDIRLIVIDALGSFLQRSDRASEGAIRDALQPLLAVIRETGVAVLGTVRTGKSAYTRRPAHRLVGSSAIPAIARSVLMIARDEDPAEPGRAILQVVKSNYSLAPAAVALRLEPDGHVHWLGPAPTSIDEQADDLMDRRLSRSERADATDFLREYLKDGEVDALSVFVAAKRAGFSEITIRRAKKDLGITSRRKPRIGWVWRFHPAQEDDHETSGK